MTNDDAKISMHLAELRARAFRFDTAIPSTLPRDIRAYLRALQVETEMELTRQRRDFDVLFAIVGEALFPLGESSDAEK